jgi:TRAP transporter TAXI family solute receptor
VLPAELKADETPSALCSGTIDASLLIVGHPSPLVKDQLAACPVNFVAMTGPAIEKLLHDNLYYKHETIPGEIYGIVGEVPTFGGRASLVTSAAVDPPVVAVVAKAVLNHVAELRTLHPARGRLRPRI